MYHLHIGFYAKKKTGNIFFARQLERHASVGQVWDEFPKLSEVKARIRSDALKGEPGWQIAVLSVDKLSAEEYDKLFS